MSRRQIARATEDAAVWHPRRGTFACAHLVGDARTAVASGARLDCVSVLREQGIWVGEDSRLHLRLPPSGRLRMSDALPKNTCVHWSKSASGDHPLRVSIEASLRQAMGCLPPDDMVAALESALHLRKISRSTFDRLIEEAPARLRSTLREAEPGAQSGYETLARLRLRRMGYRVVIQAAIPGVGHVDALIEDAVALEIDGRAFHAETFVEDRRRDLAAEWIGIRVLRIPATMVNSDWHYVASTITRMVKDARRVD